MNTTTPTVIYHSADFDGIFCREIARKFIPNATLIGWNFGDPKIAMPPEGQVYILDLSPECLTFPGDEPWQQSIIQRLIWIDHHKTSIEKWPSDIPGYRIDGVAACRLAWQWFQNEEDRASLSDQEGMEEADVLPEKQDFIDRKVTEPLAVRLAGEYDVWDHRGDGDLVLQFGLRCRKLNAEDWKMLLNPYGQRWLSELLTDGRIAQSYQQNMDADLVTNRSYRMTWEGLKFIVLNHGRFNSQTFDALDKPETGHDALLGYMFNGKCWTISLYHAKHRKDIDLSEIAKKYGGGGHKGACGFTCKTLPF